MLALSEGQRRKVSVLGALLPGLVGDGASLLVLDEPMAALDEGGRNTVAALVAEVLRRGATLLIGTHHPERFPSVTDAYRLKDGQLHEADHDAVDAETDESWPTLSSGVPRPSAWSLGRRYAWSGGTPLSGSVLGVLMALAVAALLFDASSVTALSPTAMLGILLMPSLVAGSAGDAALLTLRRDRAFQRLTALGLRPRDPVTPLVLGALGPLLMGLLLDVNVDVEVVLAGAGVGLLLSQCVAAADALGLRLARPESIHLRLMMPFVVLPFGILLDLLA
jgi:energy-coupling factor transporter ATP-binding protein EcfA2